MSWKWRRKEERTHSTAKNTGVGLAEEKEAANGDVFGIGIGGYRLKQAAEELWIYIFILFLLLGFVFLSLYCAILLLLLDPLLRHSMKLPADPSSSGEFLVRYTDICKSEGGREGQCVRFKLQREREIEVDLSDSSTSDCENGTLFNILSFTLYLYDNVYV